MVYREIGRCCDMAQKGRRSKYETSVAPYLDKIREWRKTGATVENICGVLGIATSTWFEYAKVHEDFSDAIKNGQIEFCMDLRGELAKLATRHTLETKKQYIKKDEETGNKTQYTEITTREVDADKGAIHMLLKNLDPDWHEDPDALEMRKQEHELRRQIAESNNFDMGE